MLIITILILDEYEYDEYEFDEYEYCYSYHLLSLGTWTCVSS